jgi:hypothetical protein
VPYIHSDDENSEQNLLQSEPRKERCDDEEVSYSTLYCVYVYCNVTLYIVQEMPGMQLRRKRGIRKLHVCESEDDDNELAPENQPNINSSKRVLNLLESDDGAQVNTPRRDPSSRSSKLQELKSTQRERLLQKLHQGKDESETDSESTSDDDQRVDPNAGVVLSGEQILFPESDSEEMDWIVSDSENSTHDYDVQEADCTTDVPASTFQQLYCSCCIVCNGFLRAGR